MFRVVFAAAILAASSVSAFAANFDWAGPYAGGHFGLGALNSSATFGSTGIIAPPFVPGTASVNGFGPLAGVQAGIQGQAGNAVFGAEVDGAWAGINATGMLSPLQQEGMAPFAGSSFTATQSINWLATARLRAGYADDVAFFYLTGGLIAAGVKYTATTLIPSQDFSAQSSSNRIKYGWTLGAGSEVVVGDLWTMKMEALYFDLGNENQTSTLIAGPGGRGGPYFGLTSAFATTGILFRAGLNRHF